ncbi:MAG: anti-sigma factor [Pseudomonadota bacterium]
MNLQNPDMLDRLASDYVLGTMPRLARRRFTRLLATDMVARRAVQDWERRLAALSADVPPQAPPDYLWSRIEAALDDLDGPRIGRVTPTSRWTGWLAAMFAFAALTLGWLYWQQDEIVEAPAFTSILQDAEKTPTFIVDALRDAQALRIRAFTPATIAQDQTYELWLVPASGDAPVSLGLLGQGDVGQLTLSEAALAALEEGGVLAISIEPSGGSPTGAPTGDIPYTGALTTMI